MNDKLERVDFCSMVFHSPYSCSMVFHTPVPWYSRLLFYAWYSSLLLYGIPYSWFLPRSMEYNGERIDPVHRPSLVYDYMLCRRYSNWIRIMLSLSVHDVQISRQCIQNRLLFTLHREKSRLNNAKQKKFWDAKTLAIKGPTLPVKKCNFFLNFEFFTA